MWVIFLLVLTILYLYVRFVLSTDHRSEGFTQDAPYALKQGKNIYDDFYAQIYDTVRPSDERTVPTVLTLTGKKDARVLVVGCKTGSTVRQFVKQNIHTVGLDESAAMIRVASSDGASSGTGTEASDRGASFRVGDPLNPLLFDPAQFSHIVCLDFGIYEMPFAQFFKNAQQWLPVGGDLVVHLVDPDKFTIVNAAVDERITQKEIEYPDFTYKVVWEFHLPKVTVKETFTDRQTRHVRENERVLDMPEANAILVEAGKYGFVVKRSFPLKDKHQYCYILERTV